MRSYGPTQWLDYYDTYAILCPGYYTSHCILYITLHKTKLKASCQMDFRACFQVRSEVHSGLHSIAHSQPAWLYVRKLAFKTLSRTLPSTLSSKFPIALDDTLQACLTIPSQVRSQDAPKYTPSTLPCTPPGMLSRTLPIALDGTLPACLTVRSQVCSQDALKHTPEYALKYTPNCTRWHTPSLLDYMLPSTLSRGNTLPISLDYCSHGCSCMLDPETCWVAGTGRPEAGGV